jgi:GxxExxY protein
VNGEIRTRVVSDLSGAIISAAIKVHSVLGPGLLESTYEACLAYELRKTQLKVESQVYLPIEYEGLKLNSAYRIDMIVEDEVIVELKSVEAITDVHRAQIASYLKLSGKNLGLIINFNVTQLKNGIRRVVVGEDWKAKAPSFSVPTP